MVDLGTIDLRAYLVNKYRGESGLIRATTLTLTCRETDIPLTFPQLGIQGASWWLRDAPQMSQDAPAGTTRLSQPRRSPGVTIDLKLEDLDRLALAGGSLDDRLFELDAEIQHELGVDWRVLDIRLDPTGSGPVQGRAVVQRALANMGV